MSAFSATNSPIAIVGIAAIMPQAPNAETFWENIKQGRYSITDVPPGRWDPALYYSPDHREPDKTYSKIGSWVREFAWDPIRWKLPVPPKVAEQMDEGQRWAVSAARAALIDAGWPDWNVDSDNVAVILGNAIGGEKHYRTSMRIEMPEVLRAIAEGPSFAALPETQRQRILAEGRANFLSRCAEINEDTMPGELANVMAGRIANLFSFRGPNFTTDAACASGLAAMSAAVDGLIGHRFDAAITGGVDRNMAAASFVKFCKIGALSATGTRPFDADADGFVMGEGTALFVLKRLEDAERDGDKIYAVILGIAGSSDGKGKGITAPNPIGQRLAVKRAWELAGVDPATVSAVEAHGTSTRVGDAAELESLTSVFGAAGAPVRGIALGSVKSNIGHLKAAAGAAGLFKMTKSLHEKVLAPSLNFRNPNPNVDWDRSPFLVNTELREWPAPACGVRRGGVSAFGFGGTNFHVALEEYIPGRYKTTVRGSTGAETATAGRAPDTVRADPNKPPLRGALVRGGRDDADLLAQLQRALADARAGRVPAPERPHASVGAAAVRAAVDFVDAADLAAKLEKLCTALATGNQPLLRMLRQQGAFVGRGPAPKVAFLYTGQGSQYVNMAGDLRAREPIIADSFRQADAVMTPLLGRPLTSYIFIDSSDPAAVAKLEGELRQTEITQPALLATDAGIHRLLAAYGIKPDLVMGHSLGEYGALVAAGSLTFEAALEAVSARGREMANLSMGDNGAMAAVTGPLEEIERIVAKTPGYVVVANINSNHQAVIGGVTAAVAAAVEAFTAAGMQATPIPVSHAFHTSIVAPAAVPLVASLRRLTIESPRIPLVANVTGEFYPADATTETMLDFLGKQVASPVQFVKGLHTLYDAGARVFVEVGPKRALHGFVEDVFAGRDDVLALFTCHPKQGEVASFNQALCGLWAAGLGFEAQAPAVAINRAAATAAAVQTVQVASAAAASSNAAAPRAAEPIGGTVVDERIMQLGHLFAGVLEEGLRVYGALPATAAPAPKVAATVAKAAIEKAAASAVAEAASPARSEAALSTVRADACEPVVITGAALGLPGVDQVFDDANVGRILAGAQLIGAVPDAMRRRMADMHITRLVKNDVGGATFEPIDDPSEVVKLAGRHAPLDVVAQFGVDPARDEAIDITTRLAIGAGYDALHDAGIPLVMRYKTTTIGTQLPDRWGLPEALRDDTGVIFASAFPGYNRFAEDIEACVADRDRREHLRTLEDARSRMNGDTRSRAEIDRLIDGIRAELEAHPYQFDRRFLFRTLAMGHSQFAELIGARGPNTQVNSACASTTLALALAEDWIQAGRCRRVVIVAADDVTSDTMLPWIGSGFLASGAAATDEKVEDAATPFDRRRHGMIIGMGAAALVVESAESARERGLQPICEVLGAVIANSAFHGTRLDVEHIGAVMESLVCEAEARGVERDTIADSTVFVSHETYTPARGGSASAEINALRRVFGAGADRIVITNTKGFTGHAMGTGIEDVVAVKALETGIVPPVPNYREPDPELGALNLSRGGNYPVRYALRLAAGFGSQVAMALLRWTPVADASHRAPRELGYAYRVVNSTQWQRWLDTLAGHGGARLEVDHRRLRVVDSGAAAVPRHDSTMLRVPYAGRLSGAKLAAPLVPPMAASAATTAVRASVTAVPAAAPAAPPTALAPPPAAEPAASPASVQAKPAAATADDILGAVTKIVAQMTGYPPDLLDPDLDLEADLGVDTVKQAEVFAAVRGHYQLERDPNLKLRDFPTLRHVAAWVRQRAGLGAAAEAPTPPTAAITAAPAAPAAPVVDDVIAQVTAIVAQMTGYPPELLDPDLDLEADLGVDTVKQAEVFAAVRGHYQLERDPNLKLRDFPTLRHVAAWVRQRAGLGEASGTPAAVETAAIAAATTAAVAPKPAEVPAVVTRSVGAPEVVAPATAAASAPTADDVMTQVTAIVAQMTGYPPDLLDPDLDLEADLGVDTVKQAEVFAAVRGHYRLERDPNLKLRDFPTLRHVAGWVRERAAPAQGVPKPSAIGSEAVSPIPPPPLIHGDLKATDAFPRRLPVPALRPDAVRCVATGVRLADARVVVMLDEGGVGKALAKRLASAGAKALTLESGIATADLQAALAKWQSEGPIAGVYWLPGLDAHDDVAELDPAAWHEALRRRVKALYATMRALYDSSPFLVSATRLGGFHGYDAAGATNPLGGAVSGFTKSYKRERPDALVKAVDVAAGVAAGKVADQLIEETLLDPGSVEIGRVDARRFGVAFVEAPFPALGEDGQPLALPGVALDRNSVFVVTGAAGSIVSAITADLAAASGGTFHLLDITPKPDSGDPDIIAFRASRDGLKVTLAERIKASGGRPTPAAIERELARIERLDAALAAVQAVEAAGGTAHYHAVNLTNAEAVSAAISAVRERSGRIDVLLHAAGLDISHSLPDKEASEFDLVFDVKSDGWYNVMRAARDLEVGTVVLFSSVAARFGNRGQTDYAAANDLLCKIASSLRRTQPKTRALALDWTAWGGIGMASRGSIPTVMKMAGVEMLQPEAGVAWIRRELLSTSYRGEVIVAGALGMMAGEYHPTGGVEPSKLVDEARCGPMIGTATLSAYHGLVVHTLLNPAQQPFLDHHRIDGIPVLPAVMGMEAFAEAARLLVPDREIVAIEDVNFAAPLKFYRDEPREVTVEVVVTPDGDDLLAHARLIAERTLVGHANAEQTVHFTGTVRLGQRAKAEKTSAVGPADGAVMTAPQVYSLYFHGPAYQVVESAWRVDGCAASTLAGHLPDNHTPRELPLTTAPRLVEACFQTAGLWQAGLDEQLALPLHVGSVRLLREPAKARGALHATARQTAPGCFDCSVVDEQGNVIMRLDDYRTVPLPSPVPAGVASDLRAAFRP